MSNSYRLYFTLLLLMFKAPFVRRYAVALHVTAGTFNALADAAAVRAVPESSRRSVFRRSVSLYRRVRRQMRAPAPGRTIFVMFEPRLVRVVDQLEKQGIEVLALGRGVFDHLFHKHLAQYVRDNKRAFGEYALQAYERYTPARQAYLRDCRLISGLVRRLFSVDAILLPKYNDDYTLELIQAFHDAGMTTVVYDREGTVTPRRLEMIPPIVARQAPACDYVLTYNETHKAFFERVFGLSRTPRPEIAVMGNPASDDWFHDAALRSPAPRTGPGRKILFFAFGEFSYVYDQEYLQGKDEVWRALLGDIHDGLMAHLREHPEDKLLYKRGAKGNRDYWPGSERLLALDNARLVEPTANSNRLIAESDIIISFQTTALIDAMHTGKTLIYCAWGNRYEELKSGLIDFEGFAREGAILHARSPEELRRLLTGGAADPDLAARKRIRETFTTNPDGQVAARSADWLAATLFAPARASRAPHTPRTEVVDAR